MQWNRLSHKLLLSFAVVFCLLFIVVETKILTTVYREKPRPADTIIVLGAHLWGQYPSPMLQYRLDKALDLYQRNYAENIIVSGGQGPDELITEAKAMANYLMARGVPQQNIHLEQSSTSTYENLKFSKEIMKKHDFGSAIVVTNTFHVYRSLQIGESLDIQISGAPAKMHPSIFLKFKYYIREFFAVIKFILTKE